MSVPSMARFLKYVWPFYNIMRERVKLRSNFEQRKNKL